MRLPALIFALACAIAGVLLAAGLGGEPPTQALPHPRHPSLLRSADALARSAPIAAYAAVFGSLQIAFFGACFALGLRRRGSLGPLTRPFAWGLLLYEAVFAALLLADQRYRADPSGLPLVLSFPLPTALLVYALWPLPLWFAGLYLRHFDDWVAPEAEIERVLALAPPPADAAPGGGSSGAAR